MGFVWFRNGRKDPNPLVACKEQPVAVTQNPRMSEIQLWQVASAEQVPKGCRWVPCVELRCDNNEQV